MGWAIATAHASLIIGTQDITADLGGETPKAVLFTYGRGSTLGAVDVSGGDSFGFADGTNQAAMSTILLDGGIGTGYLGRIHKNDKCLVAFDTITPAAIHSEASFVTFIPDGVTINWTTMEHADGWVITAMFFSGDDWEAKVDTITVSNSGLVVSPGFVPNLIFMSSTFDTTLNTINRARAKVSFGVSSFNALGVRHSFETNRWAWPLTRQLLVQTFASGAILWNFEPFGLFGVVVTQNLTGFTISAGGGYRYSYLALKFSGIGYPYVGNFVPQLTTGVQPFVGAPGQTGPNIMLFSILPYVLSPTAWGWNYGVYTMSESIGGGYAVGSQGGTSGIANVIKNVSCGNELIMIDDAGVVSAQASLASFNIDGFSLDFSVAPWSRRSFWGYFTMIDYQEPPPVIVECCVCHDQLPIYNSYDFTPLESFKNIVFPPSIGFNSLSAPKLVDDINTAESGITNRANRWVAPLNEFDVTWVSKSLEDLHLMMRFWRTVQARRYGFKFLDHEDYTSKLATTFGARKAPTITAFDQYLGFGDGDRVNFQLRKAYVIDKDNVYYSWRTIEKPIPKDYVIKVATQSDGHPFNLICPGVLISVGGSIKTEGGDFTVDYTTGVVTFAVAPVTGDVFAGYWFWNAVRFDSPSLQISMENYGFGSIRNIKLVELRPLIEA